MATNSKSLTNSAFGCTLLFCATVGLSQANEVVLYTADGLGDFYDKVVPAFERETGIRVVKVTGGSGAVVNRLEAQRNNTKADLVVTLPPFIQQARDKGLTQAYISTHDKAIPDSNKAKNGDFYVLMNNYFAFIHNPNLTPTPPKHFTDLLDTKLRGEIAYSNPLTAGDGMALITLLNKIMGEQKAFAFLEKLEPNVKFHTQGTGSLDVMVSRGEIKIANGDLQMDLTDEFQGGLSIDPFFLSIKGQKPVTFQLPRFVAMVKGAPNKENGEKFLNYLLSKQAQVHTLDVFGLPSRDDVPLKGKHGEKLQSLLNDAQIVDINWNHVIKQQAAWEKKWQNSVKNASLRQ